MKERTTSDLESWFSSSWPMSMIDVLWPRFSFCSLNSPPLDTGMLSRLAMSRFTDDFSSSMYSASMSFDTNLGNLPALEVRKSQNWERNIGQMEKNILYNGPLGSIFLVQAQMWCAVILVSSFFFSRLFIQISRGAILKIWASAAFTSPSETHSCELLVCSRRVCGWRSILGEI